jgi:hypothetical protein
LEALVSVATEAGFIPDASDEPTGLWVDLNDPLGPTLSARTLETLASVNPGIAWACRASGRRPRHAERLVDAGTEGRAESRSCPGWLR